METHLLKKEHCTRHREWKSMPALSFPLLLHCFCNQILKVQSPLRPSISLQFLKRNEQSFRSVMVAAILVKHQCLFSHSSMSPRVLLRQCWDIDLIFKWDQAKSVSTYWTQRSREIDHILRYHGQESLSQTPLSQTW